MQKVILSIFLFLFTLNECSAVTTQEIIAECRPNAIFISNYFDHTTRTTISKTYIGEDFPNQAEWDACEISAELKAVKQTKSEEIRAEGLTRIQVYMSWIKNWDDLESWIFFGPGLDWSNLTGDPTTVKNIYIAGKAAILWTLNTATGQEATNYNSSTDPNWP